MPYLSSIEIHTHLYEEVVNEVSRNDSEKMQIAINAAIEEAKGYLTAYDTNAIFTASGNDRNPVLLLYVKDIAVWHFIAISNPAVEMQLRLDRYEKAIKYLEKIQDGRTNPSLPLPPAPVGNENFLKWGSNRKRNNYF